MGYCNVLGRIGYLSTYRVHWRLKLGLHFLCFHQTCSIPRGQEKIQPVTSHDDDVWIVRKPDTKWKLRQPKIQPKLSYKNTEALPIDDIYYTTEKETNIRRQILPRLPKHFTEKVVCKETVIAGPSTPSQSKRPLPPLPGYCKDRTEQIAGYKPSSNIYNSIDG